MIILESLQVSNLMLTYRQNGEKVKGIQFTENEIKQATRK